MKAATTRAAIPLPEGHPAEAPRKITAAERDFKAYRTLRMARANKRHEGVRKVRAAKVRIAIDYFILPLNNLWIHRRRKRRQRKRSSAEPFFWSCVDIMPCTLSQNNTVCEVVLELRSLPLPANVYEVQVRWV